MDFVTYALRLEKNVTLYNCCGICGFHTHSYDDLRLLHMLTYGFHVVSSCN
jgi:hypothetical protein